MALSLVIERRLTLKWVAALLLDTWSICSGLGGRFETESVAGF